MIIKENLQIFNSNVFRLLKRCLSFLLHNYFMNGTYNFTFQHIRYYLMFPWKTECWLVNSRFLAIDRWPTICKIHSEYLSQQKQQMTFPIITWLQKPKNRRLHKIGICEKRALCLGQEYIPKRKSVSLMYIFLLFF